jgi:hypothetical protein
MPSPDQVRTTTSFTSRGEALGHFFLRAGDAPRILAYEDEVGCPLDNVLAALEWTITVGILFETDLVHAARLGSESAAAMVERRRDGRRVFVYMGPRMDAPPADPYEGMLLYDEPGVRAFEFAQRVHALAHFLRATQGAGAVISSLSKRAPELRHVRRWLSVMFEGPRSAVSNHLLAGWFSTGGAGVLFAPRQPGEAFVYEEVALPEEGA